MKWFIEVENRKTIRHPATEDNLKQAFPDGIPDRFEPFERIGSQLVPDTEFQKSVVNYVKNEHGIWNDVWSIEDMTEEEKQQKIYEISENVKAFVASRLRFAKVMAMQCTADSDLSGVQKWEECISKHESWQLVSVLPTFPQIPLLLKKDIQNNEWVESIEV